MENSRLKVPTPCELDCAALAVEGGANHFIGSLKRKGAETSCNLFGKGSCASMVLQHVIGMMRLILRRGDNLPLLVGNMVILPLHS